MEEALRTYLLSNAPINTACGGRIHWSVRPQGSPYPALVLTVISGAPERTFSGPDPLERKRVQIDAYALSYGAAKALARLVKEALSNLTFDNSGVTFWAFSENERDLTDTGATDAERIYRISSDFLIWHKD